MAQAMDDNSDLDELVAHSDAITEKFMKAADHLQNLIPKVDNQMLLTLYGYFKQGTEGFCNTAKPSWFDMKAKAKWEAWKKLGKMPANEAKISYVQLIEKLDPNFAVSTESNIKGSTEGWVTVSTLQTCEEILSDNEKSIVDYVKEGNSSQVVAILQSLDKNVLPSIVNKIDEDGLGLIHWAADRGCPDTLEVLLKFEADVNLNDTSLQTALHYSASCGHLDCVKLLLKNGADVNAKDEDGFDVKAVASDSIIKELLKTTP